MNEKGQLNFIFVSPQFPKDYWNFCDRLHKNHVNVLGIGDSPYDSLDPHLKNALTEYYLVSDLGDYRQMFKAVAFFSFKYGKIDWIESNNEYWLMSDAHLRTDFNITTGIQNNQIDFIKEKSLMKKIYLDNNIPTARQCKIKDSSAYSDVKTFIDTVGYPVIVKPDIGVGATNTWKLENDNGLDNFFNNYPGVPYVCEEFITGDICSYDAIVDSNGDPLFESMTHWPSSVMDIVEKQLDLWYYTVPYVPDQLRELGRKTVKAFNVRSRFVHLEFFCLKNDKPGLGNAGDFVALEVNMRPAGGYTPDMMNFAHNTDVYQIYADMVTADKRLLQDSNDHAYCAYASRRDGFRYVHDDAEIMSKYGSVMKMHEEMPKMNWPQMGRYMYTARLNSEEEVHAFFQYVQERKS